MAETQTVTVWPASLEKAVTVRETPYRFLAENVHPYSPARLLWWALKKMRALTPFSETVERWSFVPQQQGDLHDAMLKAMDGQWELVMDRKAVFIVGSTTFSELANAPVFREHMRFDTGPFCRQDPYYGRRVADVPIHVVPHITGMALVPRVIVERERRGAR